MGGYVAGPPVMAALLRRIPVVVMEPNAVPGFTNRVISRFVARALVSFPETAAGFPKGRTEVTGLPVREEFFQIPPKPRETTVTVLITGGSQGSRTLNQAVRESWPLFRKSQLSIRFLHQTGRNAYEELRAEFAQTGFAGEVTPFIIGHAGRVRAGGSDRVPVRSGAVAEIAAAGKPSVLVPFPFAADDHQRRNAAAFERAGAARLVADKEMTGEKLFAVTVELAGEAGTPGKNGRGGKTVRPAGGGAAGR